MTYLVGKLLISQFYCRPGPPLIDPNYLMAGMANPVVTDMAMQYGQDLVGRGQEELKKNLDRYVSIGQLKYYFAVDTNYVGRKIGEDIG